MQYMLIKNVLIPAEMFAKILLYCYNFECSQMVKLMVKLSSDVPNDLESVLVKTKM